MKNSAFCQEVFSIFFVFPEKTLHYFVKNTEKDCKKHGFMLKYIGV